MIFTENLNAIEVQHLFSDFLLPFTQLNYLNYHRIHMDNAPTHKADTTIEYKRLNRLNDILFVLICFDKNYRI
jgi:hypothetical protein